MSRVSTEKTNSSPARVVTFRQTEETAEPAFSPVVNLQPSIAVLSPHLQRLLELMRPDTSVQPVYKSRFLIKKGHQFISVPVTDIRYFYSREKICFIKTSDNKDYMVSNNIAQIEEMVSPELFFRVSRKYIVSHSAITKILVWFNGKLKIELQPGETEDIMISRERVNGFKAWLGE
jgi:two-component system, LytTR family, response regulator